MTTDKPKTKDYIIVDNSALYNELRSSIVSPDSWKIQGFSANCDLTTSTKSVKAMAQIGPEPGSEGRLQDSVREEWKQRVADYVLKLDDLTADILDAAFAMFIERCTSPEQTVVMRADDFLRFRSLQPRGHGYWSSQKQEIAHRIAVLSNTWINLHEAETYVPNGKGKREKLKRLRSRALVVSSVAEEESSEGTSICAWKLRPGDLFIPMLTSQSGKQIALLSKKVLAYDYYRHAFEKRTARYLFYLFRVRQNKGEYLKGIRVSSILAAIRKTVSKSDPIKTKNRLEAALDRLCEDEVIRSWQYQEADESVIGRRGWANEWMNWCIVVEPPQEVLDQYSQISMHQEPKPLHLKDGHLGDEINEMKATRLGRGLTQLMAAEQLGIAPNYYAMLERGVRRPSDRLLRVITNWLKL